MWKSLALAKRFDKKEKKKNKMKYCTAYIEFGQNLDKDKAEKERRMGRKSGFERT